ncbi:DUF4230 domain-containing protein [Aureibaculum sp. 2210JD6-5]|uniref:DUF4230 domain-containing protein n=1 Tax=Aureibaculum sp. 2210JD6-5 TaxID=3103957 RepID=UPI002AADBFB9|nr:DUF4230 domain-containing protein [Aureibaculum sp. 2210JD6-5]MDY7395964.1 DUF4230 domain-containing protein [Aureibaculum sp. 2210JD6-5]
MKKVFLGIIIAVVFFFVFRYCENKKDDKAILYENSMLIQEQIKNVGKLIVTEGHFSEVFNYKNSKALFTDYFTADKKALVVVNADVTISYDLSKIEYKIDEATKTLQIISIPKEEISISPDLEYYDIQADYFNPFEAKDYNDIKETIKTSLIKKLQKSDLQKNAKTRLLEELTNFYVLTNSLGWTLKYEENTIMKKEELFELEL